MDVDNGLVVTRGWDEEEGGRWGKNFKSFLRLNKLVNLKNKKNRETFLTGFPPSPMNTKLELRCQGFYKMENSFREQEISQVYRVQLLSSLPIW